jgi:hypothetical protein
MFPSVFSKKQTLGIFRLKMEATRKEAWLPPSGITSPKRSETASMVVNWSASLTKSWVFIRDG